MAKALPPLTWFRAFEASARHLSFTAAAEELHLTQSAISQQVRSLEIRFGVPLFRRKARGLALTDEGRRMLPEVSAALGVLAGVARGYDVRDTTEQLTVAASVSFIHWVIAPVIQRLRLQSSNLKLRLISVVWPDDFKAADADIEIRFGSEALVGEGARRLLPDDLIVVASPSLAVDVDYLGKQPLIETVGTADGWDQWAQAAGYTGVLEPSLYVDYHGAALDLSVAGAGVALTSSLLASPCLADGSLVQIRNEALHGKDGYFLAVRTEKAEAVTEFTRCLEDKLGLEPTPADG